MKLNKMTAALCALAVAASAAGAFPIPGNITGLDTSITASAADVASGKCGNYLNWKLDSAGTLTVTLDEGASGTNPGKMYNFGNEVKIPWYDYHSDIKKVVLADGVQSVGLAAFFNCDNLTSVIFPNSLKAIYESAFMQCTKLKSVTVPSSVEGIGGYAFTSCTELENITFKDASTIEYIGMYAFEETKWLDNLREKSPKVVVGSILIDDEAKNSPNGRYVVPDDITMIAGASFALDNYLKTLVLGKNVKYIGMGAFAYCHNLTSVTLNDGLEKIEDKVFYNCENLKKISIPESVTDIEEHAVGYMSDPNGSVVKIPGFTIYGKEGSTAEKYAGENGLTFVVKTGIPGDLNDDSNVNVNDLLLMQKYVAGWNVLIDEDNAELDGKEGIKIGDLILLQKKVAGWKVF